MTYDQTLKARPTKYKGIDMRSRLEAKYAQYLDGQSLLVWEYEPNCFASERGQYLPDFKTVCPQMPCDSGFPGAEAGKCLGNMVGDVCYRCWEMPPLVSYTEVKPLAFADTVEKFSVIARRMLIILDSEPESSLEVALYDSGDWVHFSVFDDDGDPGWFNMTEAFGKK